MADMSTSVPTTLREIEGFEELQKHVWKRMCMKYKTLEGVEPTFQFQRVGVFAFQKTTVFFLEMDELFMSEEEFLKTKHNFSS